MQDTLAAILERMAAFVYVLKNKICGKLQVQIEH
jgi:hypothetical protein